MSAEGDHSIKLGTYEPLVTCVNTKLSGQDTAKDIMFDGKPSQALFHYSPDTIALRSNSLSTAKFCTYLLLGMDAAETIQWHRCHRHTFATKAPNVPSA